MAEIPPGGNLPTKNSLRERFFNSRFFGWLANLPPVAWLTRRVVQRWLLRHTNTAKPLADVTVERPAASGLEATLQGIVQDVVDMLGYAGAMVATYEQGDSLPVRAIFVDPAVATQENILTWERRISEFAGLPIHLTDPETARVYVYDPACAGNLSVQAVMGGGPVTSESLYDLFTPIAPLASRPVVDGIQQALGVQEVIAVPFFLEVSRADDETPSYELVGNLFAAKRSKISAHDIMVLSAFGRQAAAAIGSERRRLQIEIANKLIFRVQTSLSDEARILQWIVQGVVADLGYVGAMVAPYEPDGSLPAYALYVDPSVANLERIQQWEVEISRIAQKPVSITDPKIARVYVDAEEYQDNLSVRAARAGHPITTSLLYDLLKPLVPPAAQPVVAQLQEALGIRRVVAVPFFLETFSDIDTGKPHVELIGNLFAATRSREFKRSEIELLQAFGQHAAAGIRNARLYRRVEERQQAAQMFGRMAFSAATAVHALRNHIGVVRLHLELLERLGPEDREAQVQKGAVIMDRLNQAAGILDTLREPWHQISDDLIDVNECLVQAVNRVVPVQEREGILVKMVLSKQKLPVLASLDMMTEAFKVIIKNAFDAMREKFPMTREPGARIVGEGILQIQSRVEGYQTIEVLITDNGLGISQENIHKIFEIGWSTKRTGMGFGLFWTKDYIEGLGGTITVESVPQEGTTFRVRIPRA
ncbi:MAG: HAMP domain-containing histidine kinase [Anaerolineae bacterium]|nr:HAMP domain-containing histidine kinase [Anaerolineae bacterium]